MNKLFHRWHAHLDMPIYDRDWHQQDIADEFSELREAKGLINVWSELADVSYIHSRARWSGFEDIDLPIGKCQYLIGLLYMFPKFHLRWKFYMTLGQKLDPNIKVREIRNPKKIHKLEEIADKYGFDKEEFTTEAKKMLRRRIFLK